MLSKSMWNNVYIVIPTYNEADNIQKTLSQIKSQGDFHIIIVDDNSPDGTANLVRAMENIIVISRAGKLGIGSAIREGMKKALTYQDCQFILTMDADMSHDPKSIPDLLAKAAEVDMVQGSRFMTGGRDLGRTWFRQTISRTANFLYRLSFNLRQKEVTTYFRVYSRRCAEIIVANSTTNRYEFAMESALIAKEHNCSVAEVPIVFMDRHKGKSKLKIGDVIESALYLMVTFIRYNQRIIKFCIVGATGIVVNQGFLWFLTDIVGIYYLQSALISIELSILSNFIFNNQWTFKNSGEKNIVYRLFQYNLTCVVGAVLNYGVLWLFTELLQIYYLISNLIGIVVAFLWNYGLSSRWVWKK